MTLKVKSKAYNANMNYAIKVSQGFEKNAKLT